MQRIGFTFRIKPGLKAEYKKAHDEIWPEMAEAIKEHGINNYSIFFRGDGTLFAYLESEGDHQRQMEEFRKTDINRRWQLLAPAKVGSYDRLVAVDFLARTLVRGCRPNQCNGPSFDQLHPEPIRFFVFWGHRQAVKVAGEESHIEIHGTEVYIRPFLGQRAETFSERLSALEIVPVKCRL